MPRYHPRKWWARYDSNLQPDRYERSDLSESAYKHCDFGTFTSTFMPVCSRVSVGKETDFRSQICTEVARNAQQNGFISYAVLNYYKIIEIRNHGKEPVRRWFRAHFEALRTESKKDDDVERFLALCGNELPHEYIHNSCRIAVAHAGKRSKSDPDDSHEIVRLHTAARVMHLLARRFIEQEFGISDVMYSGT